MVFVLTSGFPGDKNHQVWGVFSTRHTARKEAENLRRLCETRAEGSKGDESAAECVQITGYDMDSTDSVPIDTWVYAWPAHNEPGMWTQTR